MQVIIFNSQYEDENDFDADLDAELDADLDAVLDAELDAEMDDLLYDEDERVDNEFVLYHVESYDEVATRLRCLEIASSVTMDVEDTLAAAERFLAWVEDRSVH